LRENQGRAGNNWRELERAGESWRELERAGESWREKTHGAGGEEGGERTIDERVKFLCVISGDSD
jgi:hypothetical protein